MLGSFAALYSVNPADASATPIGTGTGVENDCAGQAAYDPTTGVSYYIAWANEDTEGLGTIDLTTGLSTVIPWSGDGTGNEPDAMAIGKDGKAYVLEGGNLYSLDLTTAAWTSLGSITVNAIYSFSVDPTSGLFYGIDSIGAAYRIDVVAATPTATFLGNILTGDAPSIYSLQIDTSGAWWVEDDLPGEDLGAEIYVGAGPSGEEDSQLSFVGLLDDPSVETGPFPYSESLLITYPKALAATGTDGSAFAGAAAGAVLLLLAGGAVLVLRRRRTA